MASSMLANILPEKETVSFGGSDQLLPAWAELSLSSLLPRSLTGGSLEPSEMSHQPDEVVLGSWGGGGGFVLALSPLVVKAICGPQIIYRYFCDHVPRQHLTCSLSL